jgi:hypothetical protein
MVTRGSKFVRTVRSWRYGGGSDFAALYRMEAASGPYSGTPTASQARDHCGFVSLWVWRGPPAALGILTIRAMPGIPYCR